MTRGTQTADSDLVRSWSQLDRVGEFRSRLFEIAVLAVVLSIGTNLVATWMTDPHASTLALALGLVLTSVPLVVVAVVQWRRLALEVDIPTYLRVSIDPHRVETVAGYEFANQLELRIGDAFRENDALKNQWNARKPEESTGGGYRLPEWVNESQLLSELAEYLLLEKLSDHLADWFASSSDVVRVGRNSLNGEVLRNRFLELFTRDHRDRAAFDLAARASEFGEPLAIQAAGGYYRRLELALPAGSSIRRSDSCLEIHGGVVDVTLAVGPVETLRVPTGATYLSPEAHPSRLGITMTLNVPIRLRVRFAPRALLMRKQRRLYARWAEAFASRLVQEWSAAEFFRTCQLQAISTLLLALDAKEKGRPMAG